MATQKRPYTNPSILVQVADMRAKYNSPIQFVQVGGWELRNLREAFYDNAKETCDRARADYFSVYDIALSGGEPYATWI